MQAHHNGTAAHYRCRFPEEYGLANKVAHPRNVYLREDHLLPELDRWLSGVLASHRINDTLAAMNQAPAPTTADSAAQRARDKIKECDTKLQRHRAALEAGGNSATIARWIREAEAERTAAEARLREACGRQPPQLGEDEIAALVKRVTDLGSVISNADVAEKQKLYEHLGLKMVYRPEREEVRVEIDFNPDADSYRGVTGGVRGRISPVNPHRITATGVLSTA